MVLGYEDNAVEGVSHIGRGVLGASDLQPGVQGLSGSDVGVIGFSGFSGPTIPHPVTTAGVGAHQTSDMA
jgi:hypothetical protein